MTNPYPIPRQLRETDVLVGDGGSVYGPFDGFKIFDVDDVEVWIRPVGAVEWSEADVTVTKTTGLALDTFSIAFPYAVLDTSHYKVQSRRLAERSAGVIAGTRIDPAALEKELSKVTTSLLELRRDVDRGVQVQFGDGYTISDQVSDGDTLMKSGQRLVSGPNATDIQAAQGHAEAAEAAAEASADAAAEALAAAQVAVSAQAIFSRISYMSGIAVAADVVALRVNGRDFPGDGEGGLFVAENNGSNDTFTSGDGRTWYRAYEQIDGASVKLASAGAVKRPLLQVLADYPPSIAHFGATPDASNLETKIEAALSAHRAVTIPNGEYEITRTIQAQQGGNKIFGQSELSTRIMRSGDWDGPTLRFGKGDNTMTAGDCTVERVWMEQRKDPGFTTGQQTMNPATKQTKGQSHIEIWGGVHANMNEIRFQHGQFGISCWGTVHSKFTDIHSHGSWDNKNAAVSEALATIRLAENQAIPQFKYNTEIRIQRSYIGTGGPSPARSVTVGNVTYQAYENVGPQFGILVQGCEGLEILDGYAGGCGQSNIAFQPFGMISMVSIDNMFLDECYKSMIEFLPFGGGVVTNFALGSGIRCNSQLHTQHALYVPPTGGTHSLAGLSVSGGQYLNLLRTPFFLGGVAGAVIAPSLVGGYNPVSSTQSDFAVQAGAYVHGTSRDIHFQGGLWGGGVNDYGTTNGAKWGPVNDGRPNVTAANIRAILGVAGGTVVGGMAQTYPTT